MLSALKEMRSSTSASAPDAVAAPFRRNQPPKAAGLYDPANEKDSCGIGFMADLGCTPRRSLVVEAVEMPSRMEHRGACGCEVSHTNRSKRPFAHSPPLIPAHIIRYRCASGLPLLVPNVFACSPRGQPPLQNHTTLATLPVLACHVHAMRIPRATKTFAKVRGVFACHVASTCHKNFAKLHGVFA